VSRKALARLLQSRRGSAIHITPYLRRWIPALPFALAPALGAQWPQGGGPDGSWRVKGPPAAIEWSAALNKNILWRTSLLTGGQSGIAVWGDRLFLTAFDEYKPGAPKFSAAILGH
jgi:hypothetical protein